MASVDGSGDVDGITLPSLPTEDAFRRPPPEVERLFRNVAEVDVADEDVHQKIVSHLNMKFTLRTYQKSLSVPAIKGENSIIALKTGGGKTHASAYIAKFHKVRSDIMNKVFKAVFVVPIRVLTGQQKKVFDEAFPVQYGPSRIGCCEESSEFMERIKQHDVVICTAGVLVNCLKRKKISIEDISLLILDECHHTDKKHPYNHIMKFYKDMKFNATQGVGNAQTYRPQDGSLPQILGLSASLGVQSKQMNLEGATTDAMNRLVHMCANIDASIVQHPESPEDVESLEKESPESEDDQIVYADSRGRSKFSDLLLKMAQRVARTPPTVVDVSGLLAPEPNYMKFYQDMIEFEKAYTEEGQFKKEEKMACIYLQLFCRALEFFQTMRANDVLCYLKDKLETEADSKWILLTSEVEIESDVKRKVHSEWFKYQEELASLAGQESTESVPILIQLENLLLQLHENEKSKGILLTRTRFSTKALMDLLDCSPKLKELIRPDRLVGKEEMTDRADQDAIDKFRHGDTNLLVATDIAQEGLDIPSCNYVIRYSFVTNEIGDVQAKGRARMKGAKIYSIIIRNSLEERLDMKNRVLVEAMNKALKKYSTSDKQKFKKQVEKKQKEDYEKDKVAKAAYLGREDPTGYRLVCMGCSAELVEAADMVLVGDQHHIVENKEKYEDRLREEQIPPPAQLSFATENYTGHLYCRACDANVGKNIYVKAPGPFLGDQWILSGGKSGKGGVRWALVGEPPCTRKFKWKDVPFRIRQEDLDFHYGDVADDDDADDDDDEDPFEFFRDID